ncbi:metallophosphoesterase family protein [Thermicanus aegyptius]|uniref:metallophosphoesterase family protein n=1 Tax=Thermicanus aegyptius TaxID=94009 RepID=UPI000425A5E2|nr:metallophosphoesterase [Thermicanus aegyptius]
MKVLVMSDTHGLLREVEEIIQFIHPDRVLHCGDSEMDPKISPFKEMIMVRGNMDYASDLPLARTLRWKGLKVTITHGHRYHVKESLHSLQDLAEETGAKIILFGHSHFPLCREIRGVLYINPGSLLRPRGYPVPTFALMELAERDDGFEVEVSFYNRSSFMKLPDLGGRYKG